MTLNRTLAGLVVLAAVSFASAAPVPLAPGALVAPPATSLNILGGGTLVDSMTNNFTGLDTDSNVVFTGWLNSWVASTPSGLVFGYTAQNDSTSIDSIERLSISSFKGYSTSVEVGSPSATNWILATDATRSANGRVVSFGYPTGSTFGALDPGDQNRYVLIFTDATNYVKGSASLIDGGITNVDAFVPAPVPEPASMAVLGLGLVGLVARRRRK